MSLDGRPLAELLREFDRRAGVAQPHDPPCNPYKCPPCAKRLMARIGRNLVLGEILTRPPFPE